jgi:ribose-phosphate pyrophosphokinase
MTNISILPNSLAEKAFSRGPLCSGSSSWAYSSEGIVNIPSFIFNGGEISVKIDTEAFEKQGLSYDHVYLKAKLTSANDIMELLNVENALRNLGVENISVFIPYLPYGRQDRVCNVGESFSLQVMARLINSCNFKKVIIADPHSDVTPALINNVVVLEQDVLVSDFLGRALEQDMMLVAPDAGAIKKIAKVCKRVGKSRFLRADKLRDLSTGNILETVLHGNEDLTGKTVLIVDDICDGGYTFIKLAEVLKEKGAAKVLLYVTHGIFSKGKNLKDIDQIFCPFPFSGEPMRE